jgi:hypothetical protein
VAYKERPCKQMMCRACGRCLKPVTDYGTRAYTKHTTTILMGNQMVRCDGVGIDDPYTEEEYW